MRFLDGFYNIHYKILIKLSANTIDRRNCFTRAFGDAPLERRETGVARRAHLRDHLGDAFRDVEAPGIAC